MGNDDLTFDAVPKSGSRNPARTKITRSGVRPANDYKPVSKDPLLTTNILVLICCR
jgi:hypothetical protein